MARPARVSMTRVKRLAWYLAEFPRLVWEFGREAGRSEEVLHFDADPAASRSCTSMPTRPLIVDPAGVGATRPAGCPCTPRVYKRMARRVGRGGHQPLIGRSGVGGAIERRG